MQMKTLSIGLAVLFVAVAGMRAQEPASIIPGRTGNAIQVATTVTTGANVLRISLDYEEGVTPPDQLVLVLETPGGINLKAGKGVSILYDEQQHEISLKAACQAPLAYKGGVAEVAICHLTDSEFKLLSEAKIWLFKLEGATKPMAVFRVQSPAVLFKNYIDHSNGMKRAPARR
jgi:hypothetical protein